MSDLPNLRPSRAWRWPRLVKPIALGWLFATAVATTALSQSDGRDPIGDLRASVDDDLAGAASPDAPGLTPAPPAGAIARPQAPGGVVPRADLRAGAVEGGPPALPSLANPAAGALPAAALAAPTPNGPPRPKPAGSGDPFDAPGIRVGAFLLRPAIEVYSGYDSNPARLSGGGGSALLIVAPELELRSDWVRHELSASIRGSYSDYPGSALADRPTLDAKIDGRIDVTRDTRINLEARSLLGTDYPGSPNLAVDIAKLPIFTTVGGTLGLAQRFGLLDVALKGMIDRTTWQDSLLTDGSSSSNDDRNFNQIGGELRAAYALTGILEPFMALDVDSRVHDLAVDRSGLMRDSEAWASRAGVTLALAQRLTGELALGYLSRTYEDPTLAAVRGPTLDSALLFILTPLTSVKLMTKSTIDESVVAGVSGVLQHDNELSVDHALRRWLIATLKFDYGFADYVGSIREDRRYLASLALTYKLSPQMQLKGELQELWLCSSEVGQNYAATLATIGLRYQP